MQGFIRVALWNNFGQPKVDRDNDGLTTIHLGLDTEFPDLNRLLANVLDPDEFLEFAQLWTNNSFERQFVRTPEYLLIRSGSNAQ